MTNRALKEIHESMNQAYKAGIIDERIMQKYDILCKIRHEVPEYEEKLDQIAKLKNQTT